jgi:hypothetical protein
MLLILFRTKSRKEKNKLASRACRLKKKAQHEANKLKLHGLEEEHSEYLTLFLCYWLPGDPDQIGSRFFAGS